MKTLKVIRVALSLALLALSALLVWLHHDETLRHYLLTIRLSWFSLGTLTAWLIVTLLLGRVYCSTACPLGTMQDIAGWLARRLQRSSKGTYSYLPGNNWIRYLTLLLIAVGLTGDDMLTSALVDPTQLFCLTAGAAGTNFSDAFVYTMAGVVAALAVTVAVLYLAWRSGRTFCNTVCPVGTALGTVSRVSLYHFEINPDLCVNCGECERVCKASCVNAELHVIDTSRCVMCVDCAASCPVNAIKLTSTRYRLGTPLTQPTT